MARTNRTFLALAVFSSIVPLVKLADGAVGGNITVLQQVSPLEARPGDVVTVTGYALDAAHVKEIYLTNGESDYRMEILKQSDLAIDLRLPANIPAGQMRFVIVIVNRPEMLEQPVFLKILPPA